MAYFRGKCSTGSRRGDRCGSLLAPAERRAAGKNQGLDDDRHGARALQHGTDIDIVELPELEPVDRHDWAGKLHLLAQMDADEAADIAVAGEHNRMTVMDDIGEPADDAAAQRIEAIERGRSAPGHEHRDRGVASAEVET